MLQFRSAPSATALFSATKVTLADGRHTQQDPEAVKGVPEILP